MTSLEESHTHLNKWSTNNDSHWHWLTNRDLRTLQRQLGRWRVRRSNLFEGFGEALKPLIDLIGVDDERRNEPDDVSVRATR